MNPRQKLATQNIHSQTRTPMTQPSLIKHDAQRITLEFLIKEQEKVWLLEKGLEHFNSLCLEIRQHIITLRNPKIDEPSWHTARTNIETLYSELKKVKSHCNQLHRELKLPINTSETHLMLLAVPIDFSGSVH